MATAGIAAVGIENEPGAYRTAVFGAERSGLDNAGFLAMAVTPKTLGVLPAVDATLFLSIWHYFVRAYGLDEATRMLGAIWARTGKVLVFDTGEREMDASFGLPARWSRTRGRGSRATSSAPARAAESSTSASTRRRPGGRARRAEPVRRRPGGVGTGLRGVPGAGCALERASESGHAKPRTEMRGLNISKLLGAGFLLAGVRETRRTTTPVPSRAMPARATRPTSKPVNGREPPLSRGAAVTAGDSARSRHRWARSQPCCCPRTPVYASCAGDWAMAGTANANIATASTAIRVDNRVLTKFSRLPFDRTE